MSDRYLAEVRAHPDYAAIHEIATALVRDHTNGLCPVDGPCSGCDCFTPKHGYELRDAQIAWDSAPVKALRGERDE